MNSMVDLCGSSWEDHPAIAWLIQWPCNRNRKKRRYRFHIFVAYFFRPMFPGISQHIPAKYGQTYGTYVASCIGSWRSPIGWFCSHGQLMNLDSFLGTSKVAPSHESLESRGSPLALRNRRGAKGAPVKSSQCCVNDSTNFGDMKKDVQLFKLRPKHRLQSQERPIPMSAE